MQSKNDNLRGASNFEAGSGEVLCVLIVNNHFDFDGKLKISTWHMKQIPMRARHSFRVPCEFN